MKTLQKIESKDYHFNLPDIEEHFRDKINELVERVNHLTNAPRKTTHRCPVCGGNGMVPNGFYNTVSGTVVTSSISPETCRSCNGVGYIIIKN